MFGFNWVDGVIAVLLALAVIEGVRIGLLSQLFVIVGFFVVLYVAGWAYPRIIRFDDPVLRTAVNFVAVLLTAGYASMLCLDQAQRIHWSFRIGSRMDRRTLKRLETVLGGLPALAAALVLVWLIGVMIGRLPLVGVSNSVTDAKIMQLLTRTLPPVPAVLAEFDRHVDPNAQPYVSVRPKPQPDFNYSTEAVEQAAGKGADSMVRITSFSCSGIMSGSGFVISPGLVATNAHIIVGATRPIIKYQNDSFEGVPIHFDANLDLAILKVKGLAAPSLALVPTNVTLDTTVAVLGYPGGNYHIEPGIIRDTRATADASIYDRGTFGRGIYVVQADVNYGNSGGPIVMQNGQVAGIIYSKSTDYAHVAYALTSVHIATALHQAQTTQARVGTGACMQE